MPYNNQQNYWKPMSQNTQNHGLADRTKTNTITGTDTEKTDIGWTPKPYNKKQKQTKTRHRAMKQIATQTQSHPLAQTKHIDGQPTDTYTPRAKQQTNHASYMVTQRTSDE